MAVRTEHDALGTPLIENRYSYSSWRGLTTGYEREDLMTPLSPALPDPNDLVDAGSAGGTSTHPRSPPHQTKKNPNLCAPEETILSIPGQPVVSGQSFRSQNRIA